MSMNPLAGSMEVKMSQTVNELFQQLDGDVSAKNKTIKEIFSKCILTDNQANISEFLEKHSIVGLKGKAVENLEHLQTIYQDPDTQLRARMKTIFKEQRKLSKTEFGEESTSTKEERPAPAAAAIPSRALKPEVQAEKAPAAQPQAKPAAASSRLQIGGFGGMGGITIMGQNINVGRIIQVEHHVQVNPHPPVYEMPPAVIPHMDVGGVSVMNFGTIVQGDTIVRGAKAPAQRVERQGHLEMNFGTIIRGDTIV